MLRLINNNVESRSWLQSLADFVTEAVRERCEELQILGPKPIVHPALEHFNVYEDHVTIIDRKRERLVDVYLRNNVVYCQLCGERNCEHVKYAIQIPSSSLGLRFLSKPFFLGLREKSGI